MSMHSREDRKRLLKKMKVEPPVARKWKLGAVPSIRAELKGWETVSSVFDRSLMLLV